MSGAGCSGDPAGADEAGGCRRDASSSATQRPSTHLPSPLHRTPLVEHDPRSLSFLYLLDRARSGRAQDQDADSATLGRGQGSAAGFAVRLAAAFGDDRAAGQGTRVRVDMAVGNVRICVCVGRRDASCSGTGTRAAAAGGTAPSPSIGERSERLLSRRTTSKTDAPSPPDAVNRR